MVVRFLTTQNIPVDRAIIDAGSAFCHIDTIPTLEKGRPFDETAPYDCFEESEE